MNKKFLLLILFLSCNYTIFSVNKNLKVLHLSFHKGCINELNYLANELSLDLESMYIPSLPHFFLDDLSYGNVLYNMGQQRAERIWKKHKQYFEKFDVVFISDTSPLSRIFLQNNFNKHLIVWVCNRFDYYDAASLDCDFPDQKYYELIKNSINQKNVTFIPYNNFEQYYGLVKGINFDNKAIKPTGNILKDNNNSFIPKNVIKNETFFIPKYHNNFVFINLAQICKELDINFYFGQYNGPQDLIGFKGIINLPGAWSNFAFFENIQNGIPYFVPSIKFLKELNKLGNYFIPNANYFFELNKYELSEWYAKEHEDLIIYFDSWQDLKIKIENTNFDLLKRKIKIFAKKHRSEMISLWKKIFEAI